MYIGSEYLIAHKKLEEYAMSLSAVKEALVEKALMEGAVTLTDFISCMRESLPEGWGVFEKVAQEKEGGGRGIFSPPTLDDVTRGQLLRIMASDAMRNAITGWFGMNFAFQNCHTVGAFFEGEKKEYALFVSMEAQILNQSPELRDC